MSISSLYAVALRSLGLGTEPELQRAARRLERALRQRFSASALRSAQVLVRDKRLLVSELARHSGHSVAEVWNELAQQLGMQRFDPDRELDLEGLPLGLNLHELVEAGSLPLLREGRLQGFVSCAPELLHVLSMQGTLQASIVLNAPLVALASWEELQSCYQRSLAIHQKQLHQRAQTRGLALDTLAREVLGHLVQKAEEHSSQRAEVLFGSSQASFSFVLGDGRSAMARIDARVAAALEALLEQATFVVPCPNGTQMSIRSAPQSTGVRYALEWHRKAAIEELLVRQTVPEARPILVVEDSVTFAEVICGFLERAGYQVCRAATIEEARCALREQQFLGCVLDFELPDGQADEFLQELREHKTRQVIPTVVFTSHTESEVGIKVVRAGAVAVLKKSEDPRLLLAYLERWAAQAMPSSSELAA
jgi:CheY-like chemotaxis protein